MKQYRVATQQDNVTTAIRKYTCSSKRAAERLSREHYPQEQFIYAEEFRP